MEFKLASGLWYQDLDCRAYGLLRFCPWKHFLSDLGVIEAWA